MENTSIPTVHIKDFEPVSKDVLEIFPEGLVRKNMIVPLAKRDGRVVAAVPKTSGLVKPEGLKMLAGCPVDLVLAPTDEIIAFIKNHYSSSATTEAPATEPPPLSEPVVTIIPAAAPVSASVTAKAQTLFSRAVSEIVLNHASEGLFDLKNDKVRLRHRIRGVLASPPAGVSWTQSDLMKMAASVRETGINHSAEGVQWSELRVPVSVGDDGYDCIFNLSETPGLLLLTIKVDRHQEQRYDLIGWGLDPLQAKSLEELFSRQQGVILFCGAEQDGALGTLNACVRKLATPTKHVICVDSHIDSWIQDADQFIAKGDAQLFLTYLQTALSHSPDILKVRPMDSKPVWEMCLRESLRGPLVLGGAYARDAAEALSAVIRFGVDPSLVTSGLLAVVAQRKLRLNCQHCQQKETVQRERLREIGISADMQPTAFYYSTGCEHCRKTGFGNETTIYEIIVINDDIKAALHRDPSPDKIRLAVKTSGMLTLRQVAIHKAVAGQTSLAEVIRVSPK